MIHYHYPMSYLDAGGKSYRGIRGCCHMESREKSSTVNSSILIDSLTSIVAHAVPFVAGAGLYNCCPFFLKLVINFWQVALTTHVAKLLATLGCAAFFPTKRCAGFRRRSFASSVAALYMTVWFARLIRIERYVPRSMTVYS
jgi:hypothetical protein